MLRVAVAMLFLAAAFWRAATTSLRRRQLASRSLVPGGPSRVKLISNRPNRRSLRTLRRTLPLAACRNSKDTVLSVSCAHAAVQMHGACEDAHASLTSMKAKTTACTWVTRLRRCCLCVGGCCRAWYRYCTRLQTKHTAMCTCIELRGRACMRLLHCSSLVEMRSLLHAGTRGGTWPDSTDTMYSN